MNNDNLKTIFEMEKNIGHIEGELYTFKANRQYFQDGTIDDGYITCLIASLQLLKNNVASLKRKEGLYE